MNVTVKKVGMENFAKIAEIGGFGKVGDGESALHEDRNLDLTGVLDPENKAITEAAKNQIRELAGMSEAKAEGKEKK